MVGSRQVQLAGLPELSQAELKEEWVRRSGVPAPNISPELLRLGIGYQLQAKQHGGVCRESKSLLRQYAKVGASKDGSKPPSRKLTPGTRLVRDWHGVGHTVTVLDKGFEYDGKTRRSLTAIAGAITGSHRNGPKFFGLT